MISKLIKIGNSQGVMLPKALIEEAGLKGQVEINAEKNTIIIKAIEKPVRAGWEESFKKMSDVMDDSSDIQFSNSFDNEEWEWK